MLALATSSKIRAKIIEKSHVFGDVDFEWILEGFGCRFGRIFGRFLGPKMYAKSNLKKRTREPFCIGKTNTKSMSAFLQQSIFRAKFDEKSHVFWNIDFERILGGFWEGFGKPKSSIFALFSMFFRCHFSSAVRKAKKTTKMGQQDAESNFLTLGSGDPQAGGERKG